MTEHLACAVFELVILNHSGNSDIKGTKGFMCSLLLSSF